MTRDFIVRLLVLGVLPFCCVSEQMFSTGFSVLLTLTFFLTLISVGQRNEIISQIQVKVKLASPNYVFFLEGLDVYVSLLRVSKLQSRLENLMNYLQEVPLSLNLLVDPSKESSNSILVICYSKFEDTMEKTLEIRDKLLDLFLEVDLINATEIGEVQELFEGLWSQVLVNGVLWDEAGHRFRFFLDVANNEIDLEAIIKDLETKPESFQILKRLVVQVTSSTRLGKNTITRVTLSCDAFVTNRSLELISCTSLLSILKPLKGLLTARMEVREGVLFRFKVDSTRNEEMLTVLTRLGVFSYHHKWLTSQETLRKQEHEETSPFLPVSSSSEFQKQKSENINASFDEEPLINELHDRKQEFINTLSPQQNKHGISATRLISSFKENSNGTCTELTLQDVEDIRNSTSKDHYQPISPKFELVSRTRGNSTICRSSNGQIQEKSLESSMNLKLKFVLKDFLLNHDDYCLLRNSLLPSFVSEWFCEQQLFWSFNTIVSNKTLKKTIINLLLDECLPKNKVWDEIIKLLDLGRVKDSPIRDDNFVIVHHFLIVLIEKVKCELPHSNDESMLRQLHSKALEFLDFFSMMLH